MQGTIKPSEFGTHPPAGNSRLFDGTSHCSDRLQPGWITDRSRRAEQNQNLGKVDGREISTHSTDNSDECILPISAAESHSFFYTGNKDRNVIRFLDVDTARTTCEANMKWLWTILAARTELGSRQWQRWYSPVWDTGTGRSLGTSSGHTVFVGAVSISPDRERVVTGGGYPDNYLRIWRPKTRELSEPIRGHTNAVKTCVYRPDGRVFATSSFDLTVRLWDGLTGAPVATMQGHTTGSSTSASARMEHAWPALRTTGRSDCGIRHPGSFKRSFVAIRAGHPASHSVPTADNWRRPAGIAQSESGTSIELPAQTPCAVISIRCIRLHSVATVSIWRRSVGMTPCGYGTRRRAWNWRTSATAPRNAPLAAFSPDSDHVATMRVTSVSTGGTGEQAKKFTGFRSVTSAAIRVFPSARREIAWRRQRRWHYPHLEHTNGEPAGVLSEGRIRWIHDVAFDPTGSKLAAASSEPEANDFAVGFGTWRTKSKSLTCEATPNSSTAWHSAAMAVDLLRSVDGTAGSGTRRPLNWPQCSTTRAASTRCL